MLIPLSWLKKYFSTPISLSEIHNACDKIGIEIEAIHSEQFFFSKVVIGEVLETIPHPNADNLKIATVNIGLENLKIICGATNCRPGIKVAVALIGSTLVPKGETQTISIKKSKIRGEVSYGMLCSHQELNITPPFAVVNNGILELPSNAPLGENLSSFLSDHIIELSITPNLGHCCSLWGFAREIAAVSPHLKLKPFEDADISINTSEPNLDFKITSQDCFLYFSVLIKNISVHASPILIQTALESIKVKTINNIVDITNFIMFEQGQPLHAFDADKIDLSSFEVTNLQKQTEFSLLNAKTIILEPQALVIQDKNGPLALAGIIGGEKSKISLKTTNVLLEAAVFSPKSVRSSSHKYDLHTDSSYRFERGVDFHRTLQALKNAVNLIKKSCPEAQVGPIFCKENNSFPIKKILLRSSTIHRILSLSLSPNELSEKLLPLGFNTIDTTEDSITVHVPSYRNDINEEIDLVEEICRAIGFEKISKNSQLSYTKFKKDKTYLFKKDLRKLLIKEGLTECYCSDLLVNEGDFLLSNDFLPHEKYIFLKNTASIKTLFLRPSLLQGLLSSCIKNANHKLDSFIAFEIGEIYYKQDSKYIETSTFACIGYGSTQPFSWEKASTPLSFFDFKGILENIFSQLFLKKKISFIKSSLLDFHPYQQAIILLDHQPIGKIGQLHPNLLKKSNFKLNVPIFFIECSISPLNKNSILQQSFHPIPLYPAIQRDWTISVKQNIEVEQIIKKILEKKSKWLESVSILSVYENNTIGKNIKNVSFRLTYRDTQKTLLSKDIDNEYNKLITSIEKQMTLENFFED